MIQKEKECDVGTCFCNSCGTSLFLIVSSSFKWILPILPSKLVNIPHWWNPSNICSSVTTCFKASIAHSTTISYDARFLFPDLMNSALPVSSHSSQKKFQNFHSDIRHIGSISLLNGLSSRSILNIVFIKQLLLTSFQAGEFHMFMLFWFPKLYQLSKPCLIFATRYQTLFMSLRYLQSPITCQ